MINARSRSALKHWDQAWRQISASLRAVGFMLFKQNSSPATRIIRETARSQKRLLFLNIFFTSLLGVSEACILGVIFTLGRLISGIPATLLFASLKLSREEAFIGLLLILLGLQLISSFCRYMGSSISGWISASCQSRIIPMIHKYIMSLTFTCASSFKTGELTHLVNIAPVAVNTEIEERSSLITNGFLTFIYLVVLTIISPWLILLVGLLGLSIAATQSWLRPKIRSASRDAEKMRQDVASRITADIQVLRLLHSNAATHHATVKLEQSMDGLEVTLKRLSNLRSLFEPIAEVLPMLAAVLLGLLSWQLSSGRSELMIPALATFVLALQRLNTRLIKLGQSCTKLDENSAALRQLNQFLETSNKIFKKTGGQAFTGLHHKIEFRNISLTYPQQKEPALSRISFTVARNSTVALVGASGAGKSSIIDLLIGLTNPSNGSILIDGIDLQTLDLESWQQHLGVVSQDVLLVHDTIATNIAFGSERTLSEADIIRAANAACADDFINKLPSRYATVIGEHGHRLSGGERQRLSLARAILRQPEILILDEATSALDSHLEARVQKAIQAFGSGRTVLTVAHRLSSIRDAEIILVIDSGKVIERGNHNTLLAAGGAYANLWNRQQGKSAATP